MRRVVIALLALAGLAAAGTFLVGHTRAVDDEQAAKDADRAFVANLDKGDQKAIGGMLDRRFTWTNTEGLTRTRRETLNDFAGLAGLRRQGPHAQCSCRCREPDRADHRRSGRRGATGRRRPRG